jgi:integrase/recombinase XerD
MVRRTNKLSVTVEHSDSAYGFDECVELFMRDCMLRNLAPDTLKYYRDALRPVIRDIREETETDDPAQITMDDVENAVILRMIERGCKETTINAKLRALRAFYKFLARKGIVNSEIADNIKLMKERKNVIETFSAMQISQLFRAIDKERFTGQRDYTMLLVMLETGIRLRELVGIRLDHVDIRGGFIRISEAKGNKERYVPIQHAVRNQLKRYMKLRGSLDHDVLFVNIDNEPLTKRQVQNRIHELGDYAGIKNVRCSPHTFRHTFAKMAVQNGANVFELQAILGHTTLDMVRKYVNLFSSDIAKGHSKFSPVQNLNIE